MNRLKVVFGIENGWTAGNNVKDIFEEHQNSKIR